ncbi:peptidoglycan-binding protein [Phormidium tenue FACHB-886]|nr:peptidoglycan-binding protein [Phormidium tenue FACHB-886]
MQDLPILKQGNSGPAVAVVQRFLVLYGYQNLLGTVDGEFGTNTTKAVIQFQRDQNLEIKDGIVGSATWRTLAYPAGAFAPNI